MQRRYVVLARSVCVASATAAALMTVTAHIESSTPTPTYRSWWQARGRITVPARGAAARSSSESAPSASAAQSLQPGQLPPIGEAVRDFLEGQRLFERETFGGNGRTCETCHSRETGTV